jgi:hypothetical protein
MLRRIILGWGGQDLRPPRRERADAINAGKTGVALVPTRQRTPWLQR